MHAVADRGVPVSQLGTIPFLLLFFVLSAGPAAAGPFVITQTVTFSAEDQSMWTTGDGNVVEETFDLTVVDIDTADTIGGISTVGGQIPNPRYYTWLAAYNACRLVFSHSICINGATIPFVGFVGGLGNPPPQTITVSLGQNGVELSYDVDVEAGFTGALVVDGGHVDVSYPTDVTLATDQDVYVMGQMVNLSFSEVVGLPTMSTEFSDIDLSLSTFADIDINAAIEAYVLGQGGSLELADVDTEITQELFGVNVGSGEIGLRIFGQPALTLDPSSPAGLDVFTVDYPPDPTPDDGDIIPSISIAEFEVQVPNLDLASSTWDATNMTLISTHYPLDRNVASEGDLTLIGSDTGFHPTDIAKLDLDVDGMISIIPQPPVPLGLSAGIPLVVEVEGNLIDVDLGAFLGIAQTLKFEPVLTANLFFSSPVMVETSSGVFEEKSSHAITAGGDISFLHPGGDLRIDPVYLLAGMFTNDTDLLISPVVSLTILQLALSGPAASLLDAAFDAALVRWVQPLSDPLSVAQIGSTTPFLMTGFTPFSGQSLFISSTAPETGAGVPEPGTFVLLATGLAAAGWWRRRRVPR